MLNNLKAELTRRNISTKEVANLLGVSEKTVRNKINGSSHFTVEQGMLIKEQFVPEIGLDELFRTSLPTNKSTA